MAVFADVTAGCNRRLPVFMHFLSVLGRVQPVIFI